MITFALALFFALGPEIIPSTPTLEPAVPNGASAFATNDGYVVVYTSPSGVDVVHVDEAGTPSPAQLTRGFAFTGDVAGDWIAYTDVNGPGVMRVSGEKRQLASAPYAFARLAWNGSDYLFIWNASGTIRGLRLDANATPISEPFEIATNATTSFAIASSHGRFLVAAVLAIGGGQYTLMAIPIDGGAPVAIATAETLIVPRQPLAATTDGYLLGWGNTIAALELDGRPRMTKGPFPAGETIAAITSGAFAISDHGTLLELDANANVLRTTQTPPLINAALAATPRTMLIVSYEGITIVDRATLRPGPRHALAMKAVDQSAPLIATADDGTVLASWEVPFYLRRLGRIRNGVPIDGDGIALGATGEGVAIGTNGRDFLVAKGGTSLSIAYLGVTGPLSDWRVIDTGTDRPDSIIWNGSNYVVFFTRFTPGDAANTKCGNWREQIYAATIHSDLRSASIQVVDLGEGSQKNAKAAKTRDGIALAYSPAHAITEAGGFTIICRDTTDVALATLDDQLRVRSNSVLSARGPRDDETPVDVVTDGTNTVVSWMLVLDPHNNGTRILRNTLDQPIAGAVWTGSRIALIDLPGVEPIVTSRNTIAYIRSALDLGLGDSRVMVVRSVDDARPGRVRPSR